MQPRRGRAGAGVGAGPGLDRGENIDEGERDVGEKASKVAKLEGEIERLRGENLRWQQVCAFVLVMS